LPTYQYACTACGHQLEAVQSFTDDALVECPECAGRLRKLFSGVGIVFKGSGFYRTDSRSAPSESSASESSASKADTPASSNGAKKDSATSTSSDSTGSSSSSTSKSAASTAA
jgi:putative FmdB family regulatory protein